MSNHDPGWDAVFLSLATYAFLFVAYLFLVARRLFIGTARSGFGPRLVNAILLDATLRYALIDVPMLTVFYLRLGHFVALGFVLDAVARAVEGGLSLSFYRRTNGGPWPTSYAIFAPLAHAVLLTTIVIWPSLTIWRG
jgi:hypothetical protein